MVLDKAWSAFLEDELQKDYFLELKSFVLDAYETKEIYPKYENLFYAFHLLSPDKVKVIIIGQDPYHGPNQANGLAFSVAKGQKIPPSLSNIFQELVSDIGCGYPQNGDLTPWAKEGVLLINSVLSVEKSSPNSHKDKGWEIFTNSLITKLSVKFTHLVFILWGAPSQKKESLIDAKKHLILKAPHPSPLSAYRGFFGSAPFSKTNNYLKEHQIPEIAWCLPKEKILL